MVRGSLTSNLAALLRPQLFVYRDLWAWIDQPFQPPPLLDAVAEQIALFFVQQLGQQNGNLNPAAVTERLQCRVFRYSRYAIPAKLDSSEGRSL